MKSFLFAIMALLISMNAFAQDKAPLTKPFEFGVYGGVNYNFHSPNFVEDSSKALFSKSTTSMGFHFGGFADYELNPMFRLSGRLGVHGIGADFTQDSNYLGGISTMTNSITMLELSAALKINRLFNNSPAFLLTGFEYGSPLTSEYSTNVGDVNGPGQASLAYTSIPETKDRLAVFIGGGIPLQAWGYTFTPEITYRKSLVDFSNVLSTWNVDQLRIGFSLTLGPASTKKIAQPKVIEKSGMVVGYYDDGGNFAKLGPEGLKVEDILYSELYPFVPFVFFAQNSDKPDASMQIMNAGDVRGQFSLETLPQDAIEINKRTLDIIGTRMRMNPEATLACIGSIDGKTESKNRGLANRRAEQVKDYLTKNYGISDDRISVESRALPEVPSAINEKDGMSENRRVSFKSNDASILEPITIRGDETRLAKPEMLEFRPTGSIDTNTSSWALSVSQADRVLREFVGVGTPSAQRWVIRPNELSKSQVPIDYTLTTTNKEGLKSDTTGSIPVEYYSSMTQSQEVRADITISKFSLILFDFDKSEISSDNTAILQKYVSPVVKGNSTVKIYGYTDRIGPEKYNKTLATDRANAVRQILENKSPDARYEVYGRGEDVEIFDNDIATGRLLSRTVQIYVETPR